MAVLIDMRVCGTGWWLGSRVHNRGYWGGTGGSIGAQLVGCVSMRVLIERDMEVLMVPAGVKVRVNRPDVRNVMGGGAGTWLLSAGRVRGPRC